jgi:RNA polymerase sigma factor (TIGR02999 family)
MEPPAASQITVLLEAWRHGDGSAKEQLIQRVHNELHRMATYFFRQERAGHTLQPTALVNELYIRLLADQAAACRDRQHFFALAATTMRRILVDHARAVRAKRRGGEWAKVSVTLSGLTRDISLDNVLDIDAALERLNAADPRAAQVVEMRFFSGLEEKEIAEALSVSEVTVKRDWRFARAWLLMDMSGPQVQ